MSVLPENEREQALADFQAARDEFLDAFADVPDASLAYQRASQEYPLSGIVVHLTASLYHYRRVLTGMLDAGGKPYALPPQDPDVHAAHAERCRTGFTEEDRDEAVALLESAHEELSEAIRRLDPSDWARPVAVTYTPGATPQDTSAADIVRWETDHFHEHTPELRQAAPAE
ncbi:MAG TPA: DinB family protein [Candidatus Limnocylindria bacterium]